MSTSVPATFGSSAIQEPANQTNATGCPKENRVLWLSEAFLTYMLLISVLGILLNLLVLMVFCLHKKRCTVAEIYLSNLAAADLVLMSFLPFWAVSTSNGYNWPFGSAMCQIVNLSIVMNVYCSIYFLCLVSLDRYLALVKPLSNKKLRTAKCAKLGCLLVWGLGLLLGVPTIIYREVDYFHQHNKTMCYLGYKTNTEMVLLEGMLPTFGFIIPMPIISYCTWKILQALYNRLPNNTMGSSPSANKEQKATVLILAVLLAFLVCWVPFHLVKIVELLYRVKVLTACRLKAVIGVCKQIFMYLTYFNSVLNPVLYVIVGKHFRKKLKELFKAGPNQRTHMFSLSSRSTFIKSRRSVKSDNA